MRSLFRWAILLGLLFSLAGTGCRRASVAATTGAPGDSKIESPAAKKSNAALTISKETTYVTGPLRKDGSVDYVSALDERSREGVTPENNAAVLWWQAMGPAAIGENDREKYFQMLGISRLPEKGEYFANLRFYMDRERAGSKDEDENAPSADQDVESALETAQKRPWSAREFPVLAQWLAANEKPLALIVEASKRPRRYDPMVIHGENTRVVMVPCYYFDGLTGVRNAIIARAMLRLNDGKVDEAWEDLLTLHRLARLVGQGLMATEGLTASALEAVACDGDTVLLDSARLTSAQAMKMREDLERLPDIPNSVRWIDLGERFGYLDMMSLVQHEGISGLTAFLSDSELKALRKTLNLLVNYRRETPVDWDACFRMGNARFDRIVAAYHKPSGAERRLATKGIRDEIDDLTKAAADTASLEKSMVEDPRRALSERLGQVLFVTLGPRQLVKSGINWEERSTMQVELDKLAFTLAAYRADKGSYPAELKDLVPRYAAAIPKDACGDCELHYRREGDGFLLYSVGNNGRDDGGKSYDDRDYSRELEEMVKDKEDYDDLVVRLPVPKIEENKPSSSDELPKTLSEADSLAQDALAKRIQQQVKELEYSDKTAEAFAQMVTSWEGLDGNGKISLLSLSKTMDQARNDYRDNKIDKTKMAAIEKDAVEMLCRIARFRVFPKSGCSSLEDVVQKREGNCLAYSQVFYVLGNASGVSVKVIWVEEMFSDSPLTDKLHAACVAELTDGRMMMVDLTVNAVSEPFVLAEQYASVNNYLELKDEKNALGLHPKIQILDKNGVIGCIYFNKTNGVLKAKKYVQAFIGYTKAIELNPNGAEPYCNRANAYIGVGFYSYAISDCNKAIELNPKLVEAHIARGDAYAKLGQRERAISDFNKAIEINPNTGTAFLAKGIINAMTGKKEEAKADLRRAVELDRDLEDNVMWVSKQYKLDM
jgi:hypothetical protein